MSVFEFESKTGERIEREYPIGKAPKRIRVAGVAFTRCFPRIEPRCWTPKIVGHSLPRAKDKATAERFGYPRTNERGQPIFTSKKEVREFTARSDRYWAYDGDVG
jgi:hypothetical protein